MTVKPLPWEVRGMKHVIKRGTGPLLSVSVYWGPFGLHFLAWRWYPTFSRLRYGWPAWKRWLAAQREYRRWGIPTLFIERSPDRNHKVAQVSR